MSTRGVYGFRKNGIDKITYNYSDSYPAYLGRHVAEFCSSTPIPELNYIYDCIELVTSGSIPTDEQIEFCKSNGLFDQNVGNRTDNDWYCLLRKMQGDFAKLKQLVRTYGKAYMLDDSEFIKNSLWCEYAYVVNLDDNTLEFYEGAQLHPQEGNRYGCYAYTDVYYPCRLVCAIPFSEITDAEQTALEMYLTIHENELGEQEGL